MPLPFFRNIALLALFVWLTIPAGNAQVPFESKGQVFLVLYDTYELVEVINDASTPSIDFNYISNGLSEPINALAYRQTDRLLYAIGINQHELFRIDANGNMENLGPLPIDPNLFYLAGDISPDGSTFIAVGSDALGFDQEFVKINLNDPNFATQAFPIGTEINLLDIAFHPFSGQVYGYDRILRTSVHFSPTDFSITGLTQFMPINSGSGVFFDAFGDLFAYGTTAFGAADCILDLDEESGVEFQAASGPLHQIADMASAWSSVEMNLNAEPGATFPCSEINFVYTVANATGQAVQGVDLVHALPSGFTFIAVESNPFGGSLVTADPSEVRLEGMNLGTGIRQLVVKVEVGDIPGDTYESQAKLLNLPDELGQESFSDYQGTNKWDDPSPVDVNTFELDSLYFNSFFCIDHGPFTIVADQFGNNIQWFNGSTSNTLTVANSGLFTLEASSGCETVTVTYEVTAASCPYTIEISSAPLPNETFPCSEITWRYIIENDSGEEREGFTFTDTLPEGLHFVGVLGNAFGGEVVTDFPSRGIRIEDMDMALGFDTLDLLVEVGNIPPGSYFTRASISGLPSALGTNRQSDDPNTPFFDSTEITVLGTLDDSVRIDTYLCPGTEVLLNSAGLGQTFLWENGSTDSVFLVTQPGTYELLVFDGCEPSYIEYHVAAAPEIRAAVTPSEVALNLGETQQLQAFIANAGDSLFFHWFDPQDTSLTCLDCLDPVAFPLENTVYTLHAANEFCQDSIDVVFTVDNTRRIFAPTAFSPNGDGINDHFFLQSPDPGIIRSLLVADRWGNLVFESGESELNRESSGWNGWSKGKKANVDTYAWGATIQFLDGKVEDFFGTVMVVR